MSDEYKNDEEFSKNQNIDEEIDGDDENKKFFQFCSNISTIISENKNEGKVRLINEIHKFKNFLKPYPMDHFNVNSIILNTNFVKILYDFLQQNQTDDLLYSAITLLNDLLFSCRNISSLFCDQSFLKILCLNFITLPLNLKNEHIKSLSSILKESDDKIHNLILEELLPIHEFYNIINSNQNDKIFIQNSLNFLIGISMFPIKPDILQILLQISNDYLSRFPLTILKIYQNLIEVDHLYDSFNYQAINDLFSSNITDILIELFSFIHLLLKYNQNSKLNFDFEKILHFALIPPSSDNFDEKLKFISLNVVHDFGNFSQCVNQLIVQFDSLSNNCKKIAGMIIFEFAKNINSTNYRLLISKNSNIFSVAKSLLNQGDKYVYRFPLMIEIFISMQIFFEVTNFRQKTVDMFLDEFPDDTIWHFVETDDDEINRAGMNFINSCLSINDE